MLTSKQNKQIQSVSFFAILLVIVCAVVLSGCRGYRSEKPAIHPNPNLDWQAKYKAQTFTEDPPAHTVAWGTDDRFLDPNADSKYVDSTSPFYSGKTSYGSYVKMAPIEVSMDVLNRGQERYNIYCSMCHDKAGSGKGLVINRGFTMPPDLADERLISESDGYIFDVISNGVRNMPAYAKQIDEADRWAIVTYVRALQKARSTSIREVPRNMRNQMK